MLTGGTPLLHRWFWSVAYTVTCSFSDRLHAGVSFFFSAVIYRWNNDRQLVHRGLTDSCYTSGGLSRGYADIAISVC